MNWLDYAFLGVIGISVVIGLIRGFVREVISVLVWVAAFWLAIRYSGQVASLLSPWLASGMLRLGVAFAVLFIGTLLVGALISFLARSLVGRTGLSGTDRVLGLVFGALRGGLLVGLVVLGAGLTAVPQQNWWQGSIIANGYQPWVCHDRVGGWLDQASALQPLNATPVNGSQALMYWQAFCRGDKPSLDDGGS